MDSRTPEEKAAHCEAMARATYDIAEQCEDVSMMRIYLALAGRWLLLAEQALEGAARQ